MADPCPVVCLTEYRLRRAARLAGRSVQELAWDVGLVELELREAELMAANVRQALAEAETDRERDAHLRRLAQLGEVRAYFLAQQRRLLGGVRR